MDSQEYVQIRKDTESLNVIGETLLNDSDFCDVTLVCADNQHLPVHRAVICSGSNFLRELLFDSQHQRTFLYLGNVQLKDLRPLMDFLYLGSCTVERSRLEIVQILAGDLKMSGFNRTLKQINNENNIYRMTPKEMSTKYQTNTDRNFPEIVNSSRQWHEKGVKSSLPTSAKKRWCDLCENIDPNGNRMRHMVEYHKTGNKPAFNCTNCGKTYTRKHGLQNHKCRGDESKLPFQCAVCGKGLPSGVALKNHKKNGRCPKLTCKTCGGVFSNRNNPQHILLCAKPPKAGDGGVVVDKGDIGEGEIGEGDIRDDDIRDDDIMGDDGR